MPADVNRRAFGNIHPNQLLTSTGSSGPRPESSVAGPARSPTAAVSTTAAITATAITTTTTVAATAIAATTTVATATAVAATTTAAVAAATTTTTTTAAATATAFTLAGFIDTQLAATHVVTIQTGNGVLRIRFRHFHKAEAAETTGLAIVDQAHGVDGPMLREQLTNRRFIGGIRQITYVNPGHDGYLLIPQG